MGAVAAAQKRKFVARGCPVARLEPRLDPVCGVLEADQLGAPLDLDPPPSQVSAEDALVLVLRQHQHERERAEADAEIAEGHSCAPLAVEMDVEKPGAVAGLDGVPGEADLVVEFERA